MVLNLNASQKAILQSYGRSILAGVLTLYLSGHTDVYEYLYAVVAAIAPVAIRYFNKNDLSFGRISGSSSVDEIATEVVNAVKAVAKTPKAGTTPAKKAPAKKVSPSKAATKKTENN